jgi:hypothetical protein
MIEKSVQHLISQIYDGWSTSGHVLHDRNNSMTNIAMYSISKKMLVHFKPPKVVKENVAFFWTVSKVYQLLFPNGNTIRNHI